MEENEKQEVQAEAQSSSNIYTINQQLVNQVDSAMPFQKVKDYIFTETQDVMSRVADTYFMLLSNTKHDYCLFHVGFDRNNCKMVGAAAQEIFECVFNRGDVYRIEYDQDSNEDSVDIWIKGFDDEFPELYKFFPCNAFVIEVKENYVPLA